MKEPIMYITPKKEPAKMHAVISLCRWENESITMVTVCESQLYTFKFFRDYEFNNRFDIVQNPNELEEKRKWI